MNKTHTFTFIIIVYLFVSGFNLKNAIIPKEEILSGGSPKDGIPAILDPKFIHPSQADFLKPNDQVIGVKINGKSKAYPIKILNLHEVVNDKLAGVPIAVTFWPLTQTGVVYSRKVNEQALTFGVSGKLYKSNVLFYDHQTDSLWSQLLSQAISGKNVGTHLTRIPSSRMKWKSWKKRNPKTFVLSTDTGFIRNYDRDPYKGYYRIGKLWFPVGNVRKDLPPKSRVLGVVINGKAKAYPLQELEKNRTDLFDQNDGEKILIVINNDGEAVKVEDAKGNTIPHIFAYWFAWQAFYPETMIYSKE